MLIVTSSDCYCSIITFEPNELGNPLEASAAFPCSYGTDQATKPREKQATCSCLGSDQADVNKMTHSSSAPACEEAVSPTSKPRRIRPTMISSVPLEPVCTSSEGKQTDSISNSSTKVEHVVTKVIVPSSHNTAIKVPRRVDFITLSSFKSSTLCSVQSSTNDNN